MESATAGHIDALFDQLLSHDASPPALVKDEQFIRRVYLDLTGKLPGPDEVRQFEADTDTQKRAKLIDRLLGTEAYAVNWGRYWRDVLTYHTPASANYLRWQLFDKWWTEQIRNNRPWDQIVTTLVTAEGINDEVAPVNYLTALYGNPVEIAATTSRVFLGVQIQCAECHDAKTEPWKREQFHEFAAFFGRAKLVQHKDVEGRGTPYAIDGRGDGQYLMTDKKKPDRRIAMQPRFFTGENISLDATDRERREFLARVLTSPQNPWFARCYINRMWTALIGWGFFPSVSDLGAKNQARYPEVLDCLAKEWVASGYDVRWLFRVILQTQTYQRHLQPPPDIGAHGADHFAPAVCPVPLRAEQVFENLKAALGFDENDKSIPALAMSTAPAVQRHTGLRNMVYQTFKENPSLPTQEVQGTIPQALLMMNSVLVNKEIAAEGKTVLADLVAKGQTDEQIVTALYQRAFARKPTAEELGVCARYIAKVGKRQEALEDIFWSLVNSTEFLIKK